MKKSGLFVSIILLTFFLACNQSGEKNTDEKPLQTVNENGDTMAKKGAQAILQPIKLKIEKDTMGVWKVINETNRGRAPHVKKNGIIKWDTGETDAYFQFPDTIFDPVGPADSLKHGYLKHLKKKTTLTLRVKPHVQADTVIYAVFCMADSTFAQEDSPPKIIVDD